jgi:hypothetical protein
MMLKYSLAKDKIPDLNAHKMNKLCEIILEVANDNTRLIEEVNKVTPFIDKYIDDITSTESTKSASLVENLKSEFRDQWQ